MIDSKDLRIGNYIKVFGETKEYICKVYKFDNSCVVHKGKKHLSVFKIETTKPIELTEELLNKTEILKGISFHNDNFSGILQVKYNPFLGLYEFFIGNINIKIIEYLHDLQNLFYDLSKEELNINL